MVGSTFSTAQLSGLTDLNPTTVFLQKEDGTFEDVGADVLPANVFKKTIKVGGIGYLTDGDIYDLLISAQPTTILDVSTDRSLTSSPRTF